MPQIETGFRGYHHLPQMHQPQEVEPTLLLYFRMTPKIYCKNIELHFHDYLQEKGSTTAMQYQRTETAESGTWETSLGMAARGQSLGANLCQKWTAIELTLAPAVSRST